MEIEYSLTEEDILNFNLFHSDHSPTTKKNMLIGRLLLPIILITFIFLLGFPRNLDFNIGIGVIFFPIILIWFLFYPKYFHYCIKKNVKKLLAEDLNTGMIGFQKLLINENEFIQITDFSKIQRFERFITKVEENDKYIFLYLSSITAMIIPKSVIWNNNIKKDDLYYLLENKIIKKTN
ncbi:YcxB family protein [Leptospira sp. 201903074]|uniref:YcxB family protein n=1 Tax=Leptospira abararensis TaxID=2810036 RepID=UPI0019638EFD|nr:YcxB family protein [Leptospira abararensis]MBM9548749.1 YcxB family protein [Leptospira abararensis]